MFPTFENDQDSAKINHLAEYLGQRTFKSDSTDTQTRRHTHRTDCFAWTTKVSNNKSYRLCIATAYSMGQIINSVCHCHSVCLTYCLSVCPAPSRSHFLIDFRQKRHRGNNPKNKNEFVGCQHRTTPSLILPPKLPFWTKRSWKSTQT